MSAKQEIAKAAREVRQAVAEVERALKHGEVVDPELFLIIHGSTAILEEIAAEPSAPEQIGLPKVDSETWERNARKPSRDADDNRCRFCNNPVVAEKSWFVHETASGSGLWRADLPDEITASDTYGWQPIGPECAKKIPLAYRTKATK